MMIFMYLQSNSLLVPESLRNTDKRRNGPEYSNDMKKRKVDDKDSSHYVRNCSQFDNSHHPFQGTSFGLLYI